MKEITFTECPKCHYKKALLEEGKTLYCKMCEYEALTLDRHTSRAT